MFTILEKTSVGFQAVETIKMLILSGNLKPGDPLPPERELAGLLGISRPTLREAIRVLSAMNVLESRHGGGTFVTSLHPRLLAQPINFLLQVDPTGFHHLFEARQALEIGAARLAAQRITDDQVNALQQLADEAEHVISRPSRYLWFDFEIHTMIIDATDNPIYISLYQSIIDLSIESRKHTARLLTTRQKAHEDHLAIIAALRQHDAEAAVSAMRDHLESVERALGGDERARKRKQPATARQPDATSRARTREGRT